MSSASPARLLIADDPQAPALVRLREARGTPVDVLLLGRSQEWAQQQEPDGSPLRFLDPSAYAADAHEDVRTFVIELVRRLPSMPVGGPTVGDICGTHWWWLEIVEQGPYRGPFIGQLYQLALTARIVAGGAYTAVDVAVSDPALAGVLHAHAAAVPGWRILGESQPAPVRARWPRLLTWYRTLRAAARLWGAKVLAHLWAATSTAHIAGRPVIATMFPAWWHGAESPAPAERFFAAADEVVAARVAWLTTTKGMWRERGARRRAMAAQRLRVLQHWARVGDLGWGTWRRLHQVRTRVRPRLRETFASFDVSSLIMAELERSLASVEAIEGPAIAAAIRRCAEHARPSAVLYRLEWQPVEHALIIGLDGRAPAMGYLHYPFGRRYLSMQFAAEEWAGALAGRPGQVRPMPSAIVTSGRALGAHVIDQGYPASRVALCGPQRYPGLVNRPSTDPKSLRRRLGLPEAGPIVVVAPAILPADSEALAAALIEAAAQVPSFCLVLKTHPNQPNPGPAFEAVLRQWGPARAKVLAEQAGLYDFLGAADVLVCVGSMIAFEAMALGVMPVVYEHAGTYAATSLAEYQDALYVVHNGASLGRALKALAEGAPDARRRRDAWPVTLDAVLGDRTQSPGTTLSAALSALGVPGHGAVHA